MLGPNHYEYLFKLTSMLVYRTKKLFVRSTCVGSDIKLFHKQTEETLISQRLQELPDPDLLCLQKRQKASL